MDGTDIKELMWNLLIQKGGAIINKKECTDFYCARLKCDEELTRKALNDFRDYGIDYEASSVVEDGSGSYFTDTFNEPGQFHYLIGTVVSINGNSYCWGAVWDSDRSLMQVLQLLSISPKLDVALDELGVRLKQAQDREVSIAFAYYCRL